MTWYRAYDREWKRSGYVNQPQYSGQMPTEWDFAEPIVRYGNGRPNRPELGVGHTADGRTIFPVRVEELAQ